MNDYADWIGRSITREDHVTARLMAEYRATLDKTLAEAPSPAEAPPGLQLCLAPDICAPDSLGRDGHPKTGLFLPALPLPRRMWAGGHVETHAPLREGDAVIRTSTIEDVTFKTGRSGKLGFVTVWHAYTVAGDLRIRERQDIVYREDPAPDAPAPAMPRAEDWPDATGTEITPDPTLLFRYSAITFNGHRIHYDLPYATGIEGYAGLVVHGPLQAVWMQNLAARHLGRSAPRFTYRGMAPLICGQTARIEGREMGKTMELRVRRLCDGVVTMQGRAETD